jgi:murein DD-endopeptidase MepM/ murein hydrolase activator NlpD
MDDDTFRLSVRAPSLPIPRRRSRFSVDLLIHRADELSVNLDRVAAKLHADADKVARTPSIMPTAGWLTSQFSLSRFHPILHKYLPHLGIDVAAPYGTTVVAPAAGTVIRADWCWRSTTAMAS